MTQKRRTSLISKIAGILWMILSHRHSSLQFNKTFPVVKEASSHYKDKLYSLGKFSHCMSYENLKKEKILKEKYWKFSIFMAAATSLPVLQKASCQDIIEAVCAKASIATSAKLLDNLNDEVHSYREALHSLSEYRSALQKGVYTTEGNSSTVERSAHEIATWVYNVMSASECAIQFVKDVELLITGQIASLQHKKGEYPSMEEYLSQICERSIGNVWIDADLAFSEGETPKIKEGNKYIFKSYLIYDDVQDIVKDLEVDSVNGAIILGLEKGILSEEEIKGENSKKIIQKLKKSGIFQDLVCLGDLTFLKGLEIILNCKCSDCIDKRGLAASLGMIRMFNMRRTLKREKNLTVLGAFLASPKALEKVRDSAPRYICDMVEHIA